MEKQKLTHATVRKYHYLLAALGDVYMKLSGASANRIREFKFGKYFEEQTPSRDINSLVPAELELIFRKIQERKHKTKDFIMYITLEEYGTSYQVLASSTKVKANAKMIDARTGTVIWKGSVVAMNNGSSGGGLAGMLVAAAISQAVNSSIDYAYWLTYSSIA